MYQSLQNTDLRYYYAPPAVPTEETYEKEVDKKHMKILKGEVT